MIALISFSQSECESNLFKVLNKHSNRFKDSFYVSFNSYYTVEGKVGERVKTDLYKDGKNVHMKSNLMDVYVHDEVNVLVFHLHKEILIQNNKQEKNEALDEVSFTKVSIDSLVQMLEYVHCEDQAYTVFYKQTASYKLKGLRRQSYYLNKEHEIEKIQYEYTQQDDKTLLQDMEVLDYRKLDSSEKSKVLGILNQKLDVKQYQKLYKNYTIKDTRFNG